MQKILSSAWCESCDGPMSDSGRFPAVDSSNAQQYRRRGDLIIVPRIDRTRWPILICSDCAAAFDAWDDEGG
jgi:hypothetical protein